MTAAQIIAEIEQLEPAEQEQVIRFAIRKSDGSLKPAALSELGRQLATSSNVEESARVREEIERGFFGDDSRA